MKVKHAKIAVAATVRWKRVKNNREQAGGQSHNDQPPAYASRLLTCTVCMHPQETKSMQLRTYDGYRGIHCRACGRHESCIFNLCQCGVVWHQCEEHRLDSMGHASRGGNAKSKKAGKEEKKKLSSSRKAPTIYKQRKARQRQGKRRLEGNQKR